MLNGLDLFTGIGGIALGLEPWVRPVAYCEFDDSALAVLTRRIDDGNLHRAPIWKDVRTLQGDSFPRSSVDIISGGFPCQDLSVAGKRAGLDGERSGLYREVLRLAAEVGPTFVFLENVPGIIKFLPRIRADFAALGFVVRACRLSAASVGAPHLRDRIFMLAAHIERIKLSQQPGRSSGTSGSEALQPPPPPAQRIASHHHHQRQLQPKGPKQDKRRRTADSIVTSWRDRADEGVSLLVHGLPVRMVDQRLTGNACIPAQAREAFRRLMGLP